MSALNELYQEMILEHNKKPRNFRAMPEADHKSEGYNPLCGDRLVLYLKMEGDRIKDISFEGSGCAISKASASMMTASIKGKNRREVENLTALFRKMLTREIEDPMNNHDLGKLAVFSGVWEFPARIKCASLAWHTLLAGLEGKQGEVVTTEAEKENPS